MRPGSERDFIRHYSPDGTWAALFRKADGYVRTELFRSTTEALVFLTVDTWESREAFHRFRGGHALEYERLDEETASLTTAEEHLGESA